MKTFGHIQRNRQQIRVIKRMTHTMICEKIQGKFKKYIKKLR